MYSKTEHGLGCFFCFEQGIYLNLITASNRVYILSTAMQRTKQNIPHRRRDIN